MSSIVTHTPIRHFTCAKVGSFVSMLKIKVLKMLSHIMNMMQREVVIGERARVSTKFRFEYTYVNGSMYITKRKPTTTHFIQE